MSILLYDTSKIGCIKEQITVFCYRKQNMWEDK